MTGFHWRRTLPCLALSALLIAGCQPSSKPPSQFSQAQQDSTKPAVKAVAKDATQGSEFNKFFPKPEPGYERVYTQEKKGFAEAKLKKAGKEVAMLSISDTSSVPSAADKYQKSTEKIGGFPTIEVGNTQTGVLVAKRYQVKVLSRDPSFDKSARQSWIAKFDLNGLAKVK